MFQIVLQHFVTHTLHVLPINLLLLLHIPFPFINVIAKKIRIKSFISFLTANFTTLFPKYSRTCLKPPLKNRQNKGLKDKWKLNEG